MSGELATVKEVAETGLAIVLPDGTEGRVPLSEVFQDEARPVVLRDLVYVHPISIAVGQSIPVLPIPDQPGRYSRKSAVRLAWELVSPDDEVRVTISEITPDWIFGIADQGFKVCLLLWETE